ncbi:related to sulfate/bicarbonate/oxalate exchanger SAT-1 and related transporters (SLC26 family) [Ramularia collo-cygni]|uniref:Related to sulfate/bicarbonate/oxalate exchanger SAT-1 and related transporters (SLC26 family) n=1 Tax=Ramularia collo-cygni TaxID=112498 RepID=A0A2D3VLP1_9PEZI|nr:related to sulfate/bicarbonate/oxalate exchanger SAT-1 and related transporters (SLC26 family) [Ramularia collo-cygni]CZT24559.1 related to sulfate/bicarbonate/oxalate exchanger SAT-1 and related transporters (SLC26 family) [Ramularia collo-cygni]
MTSRFFKRRKMSSSSQAADEESNTDGASSGHPSSRKRAFSTASGTAGSLPSRSYMHHPSHASAVDVQYSSSGVRQQTAEISSSFLSDSEMHGQFGRDTNHLEVASGSQRSHDIIPERTEPTTPEPEAFAFEQRGSSLSAVSHASDVLRAYADDSSPRNSGTDAPSRGFRAAQAALDEENNMGERTPLLPRERLPSRRKQRYDSGPSFEVDPPRGIWNRLGHHYPSIRAAKGAVRTLVNPKAWDLKQVASTVIVAPVKTLPAVFLGLLLNLLDALSYGIILFPLGEEVFSDMGADGVSMFYVSCIVSQLVYSSGSIFKGGVGSEMIEVVPFFHKMTYMIIGVMGTENPDALRATVITSYAMSSIITGIIFFGLGAARLGTLVNFFPHSILVGCIGGVGIFLLLTGLEVSVRLDGNLELTKEVLLKLVAPMSLAQWVPPLALAIILLVVKRYYDRPFLVPAYYIGITAIFYIVTAAVPALNMEKLRSSGWVFEAPSADKSFYNFYSYYKFSIVDWEAVAMTIPSQLALTFFGILHVPINIPNLAMKMQEDNVSINRELIMHGVSNTLSGCVGSIQNYLVYVNSVLFMDTGGDSRLAGFMLAAATTALWVVGPVVIGYVPVMVVGTLIYYLGIDLAKEALVDTYGRLHRLEYFTIVVIALVMGIYDFVVGVGVGIGLACLVYVVQTSRKTVIRAQFSGAIAESTVRRHPRQRTYLNRVGPQIRVVKLGGYLFFGSIVNVEKTVRALIDAEAFAAAPIRYLILDFSHVTGIDFSAAEAFGRMNRVLRRRDVEMVLASVNLGDDIGKSLQMDGLFAESDEEPPMPAPKVYESLNGALEACENGLLITLTEKQQSRAQDQATSPTMPIPTEQSKNINISQLDNMVGSPRTNLRHEAASQTITEQGHTDGAKWKNLKQPLPLILQAFQDITDKNVDFWFKAVPFFVRREFSKGQLIYARHDNPDGFYLLQSGILRAEYALEQGNYHESIVAGTTCGELPFFSDTERTCSVVAETECVAWLLTTEKWEALQEKDVQVAQELLKVAMKLSAERMSAITSYVLITAS